MHELARVAGVCCRGRSVPGRGTGLDMSVATSSVAFQRGPGQYRGAGVRGLDIGARASLLYIDRCPRTQ